MNNIRNTLENLTEEDTYSLMLFSLYLLKDLPEYSVLSELIYTLDKESLLKLLKLFGGQTIAIPTLKELKLAAQCLVLVRDVTIEGKDFNKAIRDLNINDLYSLEEVREMYDALCTSLERYNFNRC